MIMMDIFVCVSFTGMTQLYIWMNLIILYNINATFLHKKVKCIIYKKKSSVAAIASIAAMIAVGTSSDSK